MDMRNSRRDIDRGDEDDEFGDLADPMLDATLHDAEFLANIKRATDAGLSHASSTSAFVKTEPVGERIRKEAPYVKIPNQLPTVNSLAEWKVAVARSLLAASAYGDRAEVAWFRECSDPTKGFEHFSDSGAERFRGLDNKLAVAITNLAEQNQLFKRELERRTRSLFDKDSLPTGRQVCFLLYDQLKTNESMGTWFGLHDLSRVAWFGDNFNQIGKFRDRWQHVLEHMQPGVAFQEDVLREVLHDQLKLSKNPHFQNDLAHYDRGSTAHTYEFLLQSMDRYISKTTLAQNRQTQENEFKGNPTVNASKKDNKGKERDQHKPERDNVVAAVHAGKGAQKQSSGQLGPCYFHNNGGCTKGNECRFSHKHISDEEAAKLEKPEARGRSQTPDRKKGGKGNKNDKSGGNKGDRARDNTPGRGKSKSPGKSKPDKPTSGMCIDFAIT